MTYSIHLLRHWRFVIGQNIHQQRLRQKMPLRKLARLSCVPEPRLDQFELGKNQIHLDELFKIACALRIGIHDLLQDASPSSTPCRI